MVPNNYVSYRVKGSQVDSVTAVYTVTPKKPKSIEFDDQSKLRLDSDFKKNPT
jgi:hypothetical protein